MGALLLAVIYVAFISLGLPDSLLGSAWPVMYGQLGVPVSYAGLVSMLIAGGTIVSSLLSHRVTKRFGAGLVTAVSVLMTGAALMGFSLSGSFWMLCLWAVPYGLGAGGVDAALNNYVALHYASRHMSWLHCFWGVGASISPYIMGYALTGGFGWPSGYRWVGILQLVLTAVLLMSLPLWSRRDGAGEEEEAGQHDRHLTLWQAVRLNGVALVLLTFFGYSALETTTGLWAASFLVGARGIGAETAARFVALFFMGITAGRFFSGFVADRFGDRRMIRWGILVVLAGIALVWLGSGGVTLTGLLVIGLGCAPIYPAIIHSTPANFGREHSQAIIGIQMACAYTGSTFMPPLFGLIGRHLSMGLFPAYLLLFALLMLAASEVLNRTLGRERPQA